MTLGQLMRDVRSRWALVVLGSAVGALASAALVLTTPTAYEATAQLYVTSTARTPEGELPAEAAAVTQRVRSYATLATSEQVLAGVVERLRLPTTSTELAARVRASAEPGTVLIDVTARDASAQAATDIANAVGDRLPEVVEDLDGYNPEISIRTTTPAVRPGSPVAPRPVRTAVLGLAAGTLLGLLLAALRGATDTRLRSRDDAVEAVALPVLAEIPQLLAPPPDPFTGLGSHGGHSHPAHSPDAQGSLELYADALRRLRAHLHHAPSGRGPRSIVVAGPGRGTGRTTIACHLAGALAAAGHAVVLVDADLRHPQVGETLALPPGPGLSALLTGRATPAQALRPVHRDLPLQVITAADAVPGAADLLGSPALAELLATLTGEGYLVVVDSPPLDEHADALALARHTDATLLLARLGDTPTGALAAAADDLAVLGVAVVGVALTGAGHVPSRARRTGPARRTATRSGRDGAPQAPGFVLPVAMEGRATPPDTLASAVHTMAPVAEPTLPPRREPVAEPPPVPWHEPVAEPPPVPWHEPVAEPAAAPRHEPPPEPVVEVYEPPDELTMPTITVPRPHAHVDAEPSAPEPFPQPAAAAPMVDEAPEVPGFGQAPGHLSAQERPEEPLSVTNEEPPSGEHVRWFSMFDTDQSAAASDAVDLPEPAGRHATPSFSDDEQQPPSEWSPSEWSPSEPSPPEWPAPEPAPPEWSAPESSPPEWPAPESAPWEAPDWNDAHVEAAAEPSPDWTGTQDATQPDPRTGGPDWFAAVPVESGWSDSEATEAGWSEPAASDLSWTDQPQAEPRWADVTAAADVAGGRAELVAGFRPRLVRVQYGIRLVRVLCGPRLVRAGPDSTGHAARLAGPDPRGRTRGDDLGAARARTQRAPTERARTQRARAHRARTQRARPAGRHADPRAAHRRRHLGQRPHPAGDPAPDRSPDGTAATAPGLHLRLHLHPRGGPGAATALPTERRPGIAVERGAPVGHPGVEPRPDRAAPTPTPTRAPSPTRTPGPTPTPGAGPVPAPRRPPRDRLRRDDLRPGPARPGPARPAADQRPAAARRRRRRRDPRPGAVPWPRRPVPGRL